MYGDNIQLKTLPNTVGIDNKIGVDSCVTQRYKLYNINVDSKMKKVVMQEKLA